MSEASSHRYAVVVAGGSGTRLWPLSRKSLPKQMQKFVSDKTLIDETVDRLSGVVSAENIFISTSADYAERIKELLPQIPVENLIVEPMAKGTPAAFALLAATLVKRDPEAVVFSLASDHAVTGLEEFQGAIERSFQFVEKHPKQIALIGIKPSHADAGLGYIKTDDVIQEDPIAYTVEKFIEKPSLSVAKRYVQSSDYYWNAAYYCFRASTLIQAYKETSPELVSAISRFMKSGLAEDFDKAPVLIHEIEIINTTKYPLAVIPADFKWSDIGNWQTLHEVLSELAGGDVVHQGGEHIDIDSTNSLVFSTNNRLVATVGLDNVAVVSTDDVVLVLNKDKPQDIKALLEQLREQGLDKYL